MTVGRFVAPGFAFLALAGIARGRAAEPPPPPPATQPSPAPPAAPPPPPPAVQPEEGDPRAGFYAFVEAGWIFDFAMSHGESYLARFPSVERDDAGAASSGFAPVVGVGFGGAGESVWALRAEVDFALGSFSDWRVTDRTVWFLGLGLDVGLTPGPGGPFTAFVGVNAGMLHQSDHDEFDPRRMSDYTYLNEKLDQTDYTIGAQAGAALRLTHRIALRLTFKWTFRDEGSCGGASEHVIVICTGDPPPTPSVGKRLTAGAQFRF